MLAGTELGSGVCVCVGAQNWLNLVMNMCPGGGVWQAGFARGWQGGLAGSQLDYC